MDFPQQCSELLTLDGIKTMVLGTYFLLTFLVIVIAYMISNKLLTKHRILRFFGIYFILAACSLYPYTVFSFAIAFKHTILAAVLISIFIDKGKT